MAGGGASPPPSAAHQLESPDAGVLLLVDQPPCAALSPRHDLPGLQMALASGVAVLSIGKLPPTVRFFHPQSYPRRGAPLEFECRSCAPTGSRLYCPPPPPC